MISLNLKIMYKANNDSKNVDSSQARVYVPDRTDGHHVGVVLHMWPRGSADTRFQQGATWNAKCEGVVCFLDTHAVCIYPHTNSPE